MLALPNLHSAGKQCTPRLRQRQKPATPIFWARPNFDKTAPFQRLEGRCQGRAVHGKQLCDGPYGWRLRPIKCHHQRELTIGDPQRAESVVKTACKGAGGPLCVQAQAAVADMKRGFAENGLGI